ncbi:MAG TPA: hypothetical protein VGN25_01590 [Solirubrobacteraceae bacterium]|jgi:hypothetical protein|nr:hypothetical protein [Solirubrobacteraceae bacterium]
MINKHRLPLLAGPAAVALACAGLAGGSSYAAGAHVQGFESKVVPVQGSATLRVTHETGSIHQAEGIAHGTLGGTLHLTVDIETASRMKATFTDRLHGGTLSGSGSAKYTISGTVLHFVGTTGVTGGTGAYAHASGSGIRIEGSLDRLKKTLTMTIHGSMHV